MTYVTPKSLLVTALLAGALVAGARADAPPLPPTTRLVAANGVPTATETSFDIAAAQDLTVTLTDLQVPAGLSGATILVTQAGALVGDASLATPASTAVFAMPAAVGHYVMRIFGAPDPSFSVGTFTVCVAPQHDPSNCIQGPSIAGNISASGAAADPTVSTLSTNLVVVNGGAFTVNFSDHQFPAVLATAPNLALFQGSSPIGLGIASGTSFNLSPGTYTLLAVAQADQAVKAGAYGITISPAAGTPLLDITLPVGTLGDALSANNPVTQDVSLVVTDFGFPSALASAESLVTSGGRKLGASVAATTAIPAAPGGILEVWSFATAGASAGTYEIDLTAPTGKLLQTAAGVNQGNSFAYAYLTPPLAANDYQAVATDFEFPAALQSLKFAVAQGGVILQQSAVAGSIMFHAAAGPVVLLADATTPASGNGLFDVSVQSTAASPQLLFDKTAAASISGLFDSQTINLGIAGDFDVTLNDLKFPTQFQDLALVVSSGGAVVGKIFGGGTFPITTTPGPYQFTFIATPAAAQQHGLYAVQVVFSAPTLTLKAAPTTLTVGATTTLTWTTQHVTACTASGGNWTGDAAVGSGTIAVQVDATTTYTLTCSGPGGTSAKSVSVTATPAASSSGGGGKLDWLSLASLAILLLGNSRIKTNKKVVSPQNF